MQNLPKNVCLLNYLKLNNDWHNLLEKSPYILTTNIAIYTYYFHQKKLKEKPTIKHATSLTRHPVKLPFQLSTVLKAFTIVLPCQIFVNE